MMFKSLIIIFLPILTIVGPTDAQLEIEDTQVETQLNVVDENTVYSNGVYMDANDFTLTSEQLDEENFDTLSEIKVWDAQTGENYNYDDMSYDNNSITYYYDDMQITINYDVVSENINSFSSYSSAIAFGFNSNVVKIIVVSIVVYITVLTSIAIIRRIYVRVVKKITNILE